MPEPETTPPACTWAQSVASHGTGNTATIDIDIHLPGHDEPVPVEIPLGEAQTLHAMLGDVLAEHEPAPAVPVPGLRDQIAGAARHAADSAYGNTPFIEAITDAVLAVVQPAIDEADLLRQGAAERADLLEEARDALSAAGQNGAHGDDWPAIAPAIRALGERAADLATRATQQAELLEIAEQAGNTAEAARAEAEAQLHLIDGMRQNNLDAAAAATQRAEQAEARLTRARDRCQEVRDRVGPGGMINASQILGLLSPTWPDGNYEAALTPPADDYQTTTGHEVTCTAGFDDTCTCTTTPPVPADRPEGGEAGR